MRRVDGDVWSLVERRATAPAEYVVHHGKCKIQYSENIEQ